jgi:uracil-DNA glycosylase
MVTAIMAEPDSAWLSELIELTGAVREHLEWQQALGCTGLAPSPPAVAAVGAAPEQHAGVGNVPPPDSDDGEACDPPHVPHRASLPPLVEDDQVARSVQRAEVALRALPKAPIDPDQRTDRLRQLCEQAQACQRCVLHKERKQAVFARGRDSAEVMIVGEGPGADEDEQGEPFVGKAGQLLDQMIAAMGFERGELYICNVVKCRPPNNRAPEPDEIEACLPYLHEQIALVSPRVIIAMGSTALRGLLGISDGITRVRGKWKLYRACIPVMPTFHPAYLLRKEDAKRAVWTDLKQVLQQLGRTVPEKKR